MPKKICVGNVYVQEAIRIMSENNFDGTITTGMPKATEKYPVEELREMGLIGLYRMIDKNPAHSLPA